MDAACFSVTAAVRDARRGRSSAQGGCEAFGETADDLLDELASHMREAGEIDESGKVRRSAAEAEAGLEGEYVLEQKAKLVLMAGADAAYLVPSGQDWAHDALGDATVVPGMAYSDGEPFLEGDACVDGYFQADADGRWTRLSSGRADMAAGAIAWRASLEDFPEVMEELEVAMGVSAWRHVAEQATMKALAGR